MKTIRAHDQIEAAFAATFERHAYSRRIVFQLDDAIIENDVAVALNRLEDQPAKIATPHGDEAAAGQFRKDSRAEPRHTRVIAVDDAKLLHVVTDPRQSRE